MSYSGLLVPRSLVYLGGLIILCFSPLPHALFAQDISHTVSVAVPESLETIFENTILPSFREENPDVSVTVIPVSAALYQDLLQPSSPADLETYLDATERLVSQADVLFMMPMSLSPEATRAGYYLDLSPLVAGDAAVPIDDFVPAAWQSYQWDDGYWALPVRVTPLVIAYNPATFDAKGLTYPTEKWTLDDFANAARVLSEDGRPGLKINSIDLPLFFRTFLAQGFMDDNLPAQPTLNTPEMADLLGKWSAMETEGLVTHDFLENAPLQLARISALEDPELTGILMFGGQAGLDLFGVALSRGANDVEAAYRVATYFTTAPEMQVVASDGMPARYSTQGNSEVTLSLSPEAIQLRDQALENALPFSEVVLGSYITQALSTMAAGDDALAALQNAQLEAETNLASAEDRQDEVVIVVPLQTPVPVAQVDEVVIRFGLWTGGTDLPNRDEWERVIEEFAATDDRIDRIEFKFMPSTDLYIDSVSEYDCVYGHPIVFYADEQLLPLDPLIATDPTFDMDNVVGDVMQDMRRSDQTFILPVTISPYVLRYDREVFKAAGLPEPDGTWTVNEFVDALQQLKAYTGATPMQILLNSLTPWEMLTTAYGTPLIDYSTSSRNFVSPPPLNLLDTDAVSAAQQALDLGRSGLIEYTTKMTMRDGWIEQPKKDIPLVADLFTLELMGDDPSLYGIVTFPTGDESIPVSYETSGGFIFSHAHSPEGCYRWLRELSRHPELYRGMPAYHSVIESLEAQAVYTENEIEIFRFFANMLDNPNSVFIRPYGLKRDETLMVTRALDRYVLDDADLKGELRYASELIETYRTCLIEKRNTRQCLEETDPTIP